MKSKSNPVLVSPSIAHRGPCQVSEALCCGSTRWQTQPQSNHHRSNTLQLHVTK